MNWHRDFPILMIDDELRSDTAVGRAQMVRYQGRRLIQQSSVLLTTCLVVQKF